MDILQCTRSLGDCSRELPPEYLDHLLSALILSLFNAWSLLPSSSSLKMPSFSDWASSWDDPIVATSMAPQTSSTPARLSRTSSAHAGCPLIRSQLTRAVAPGKSLSTPSSSNNSTSSECPFVALQMEFLRLFNIIIGR